MKTKTDDQHRRRHPVLRSYEILILLNNPAFVTLESLLKKFMRQNRRLLKEVRDLRSLPKMTFQEEKEFDFQTLEEDRSCGGRQWMEVSLDAERTVLAEYHKGMALERRQRREELDEQILNQEARPPKRKRRRF